jgi:hypothetical protein
VVGSLGAREKAGSHITLLCDPSFVKSCSFFHFQSPSSQPNADSLLFEGIPFVPTPLNDKTAFSSWVINYKLLHSLNEADMRITRSLFAIPINPLLLVIRSSREARPTSSWAVLLEIMGF